MILIALDSKGGSSLISGSPAELRGIIAKAKRGEWPAKDTIKLLAYDKPVKQATRIPPAATAEPPVEDDTPPAPRKRGRPRKKTI